MSGKIVEFPCDIGDTIYEIIVCEIGKEIYLDSYIVEDISLRAIKFCGDWRERNEIGIRIFLDKKMAERVFENMKNSREYKYFNFFIEDEEIINDKKSGL